MHDSALARRIRSILGLPPRVWRRLRMLYARRELDHQLQQELAHHHALLISSLLERGFTPAAAHRQASVRMGNITAAREHARQVWSVQLLDTLAQDVTFATRSLRRHPVFALVVLIALAGGIGVGTSAFAVYSALTLRSWNVQAPEQLVTLYATPTQTSGGKRAAGFTPNELRVLAQRAQSLNGVFAYERRRTTEASGLNPAPVSASYFDVLGVHMAMGRAFAPEDDQIETPSNVIVVSDAYWREQLGAARDVIGSTIVVHSVAFRVIGVAPPRFVGTDLVQVDAWMPMSALPLVDPSVATSRIVRGNGDACCLHLAARLAAGVSVEQAAAELTELVRGMRAETSGSIDDRTVTLSPFTMVHSSGPAVSREIVPAFVGLAVAALLVLALGCSNAANLLLARALAREQEVRIRLALGASRTRLVQQFMTESLLLSVLAGLPALVIARWLPPWLHQHATGAAMALPFAPDSRTLLVTGALVVASCVLFGLAPALHVTRAPHASTTPSRMSPRLISLHMACCTLLLICAAVLVAGVPAGVQAQRLSTTVAAIVTAFVLLMVGTGVYGVLSYGVQRRNRDISVRLALGASPMRLAFMLGAWLGRATAWGMFAGAFVAAGVLIALQTLFDAPVALPHVQLVAGMLALAVFAALAMSIPLWRAVRALPSTALRCD